MKHYVVGFLFSNDLRYVLLIKKNRPEWQAGMLNGIGGKIEPNEDPITAMVREYQEEANFGVPASAWHPVCMLESTIGAHKVKTDWCVYFYAASTSYKILRNVSMLPPQTDEKVVLVDLHNKNLYPPTIQNLSWLIPMAQECLGTGKGYYVAEDSSQCEL